MSEVQPTPEPNRVRLDRIRVDATQSRASLNDDAVKDYAAAYKAGEQLPPVILYSDGTNLWMADGFHRFAAAKLAKRTEIEAEIREGNQLHAILYAVGCNDRHGLRRTNADKTHAVRMLLADEAWGGRSDSWIAETCRVSAPFVKTVRASTHQQKSKRPTSNNRCSKKRLGKDGKRRKPRTTGDRQPGDERNAKKPPALCDRCDRIGIASCPTCIAAGAKPQARQAGGVIFDWTAFNQAFGSIMRQVAGLETGYGKPGATEAARDDLVRWRINFRSLYEAVTGQKPPADPHERGAA